MREHKRLLALSALVVALVFGAVSIASGAPATSPKTIRTIGFETGESAFFSLTPQPLPAMSKAYWGPTTQVKRSGSRSLWCAGTAYNPTTKISSPAVSWPNYVTGTWGDARLSLPELENYYSSSFEFYYLMPSYGAAESSAWTMAYSAVDSNGDVVGSVYKLSQPFAKSSVWKKAAFDLTQTINLSRQRLAFVTSFVDQVEAPNETPKVGQGPTIDDFVVKAFKYGPVRNAEATPGGDRLVYANASTQSTYVESAKITLGGLTAGKTRLTWDAPQVSTKNTDSDTRPIGYRVWRKPVGGAWTELTTGRLSDRQYDDSAAPGSYVYAIQAWDTGSGTDYGKHAEKAVVVPPGPGTIAKIHYSLNGGQTVTVNSSSYVVTVPAIPGSPSNTITFTVEDDMGNVSAPKTLNANVVKSSKITFSAPSTSSYASAKLSGRLTDSAGNPLRYKNVSLQQNVGGVWKTFATTKTYWGGDFAYTAKPTTKTSYRAVFAGDAAYVGAASGYKAVLPKVYLGKPKAPKTMKRGVKTKVYGYLKPRHKKGSYPVKLKAYRYEGGKWVYKKGFWAKATNYNSTTSKYYKYVSLPYKGKWRIRAYHPKDSKNAKTYSTYDYVTVK